MKRLVLFFLITFSAFQLSAQDTHKVFFKINIIIKQTESNCKATIRIYNKNFSLAGSKKVSAYKLFKVGDKVSDLKVGQGTLKFSKQETELYADKDVKGNVIEKNPDPFYIVNISKTSNYTLGLNDLIEVEVTSKRKVESIVFELTRNHIRLNSVEGNWLYVPKNVNISFTKAREKDYLIAFLDDIQYTAKEMRKQMDEPKILRGELEGVGLFDMMEKSTTSDVYAFLTYIKARPSKYRGHTWKISEIYATWMHEGSPLPE